MSGEMPSISDGGQGVYSRIEARLDRIEDKLDIRLTALDNKVDGATTRLDRLEGRLDGSIGMVRWLGPTGVAALAYALLKTGGFL